MVRKIFGFLILLVTVSLFLVSPTKAQAQTKLGEIININYKYKIAFTDLTQSEVQTGDKVAVKNSEGATVYLEAVEVYPVMVKLTVAATPGYGLSDDQFAKIVVGSPVTVVDQSMFRSLPSAPQRPTPDVPRSGTAKLNAVRVSAGRKDPANFADSSKAVLSDQKRPATGRIKQPENMMVYDPGKVTARIETVSSPAEPAPSPVVPESQAPAVAQAASPSANMDYKVAMLQQKVDKLVDSNLAMADQITKLLREKAALEDMLKDKDVAVTIARNQILNITNTNKPQDQQLKDLQKQLAKLGEEKAAAGREIMDLNQKLSLLKKKLARMIELLNKHTKAYE
jgi:co-chaperonin GroES (HSP10)